MKAIILAAGMGTRLGKYTKELPKGMLMFHGKSLIEHQVEALRACGVNDIIIVRGYQAEKIQIPNVKYYHNPNYEHTNMVETLFCTEKEMTEDLLVCYADIIYEKRVLKSVLLANVDIGVTVDEDYGEYWQARTDKAEEDMESLIIEKGSIVDIGNPDCSREDAKVRYVGLLKFSKKGLEALKKVYHAHKVTHYESQAPWLRSKSFKKAYMTCMLQALINAGHDVKPMPIKRGWLEFDTVEDYEKYNQWIKNKTLSLFFSFER